MGPNPGLPKLHLHSVVVKGEINTMKGNVLKS